MKKSTGLIAKAAFAGLATLLMTGAVLADSAYTYDSTGSDAAAGLLFGGSWLFIWGCVGLVSCVFLAFNIWMIVDAVKRTEAEMPNRTLWLVLLIVGILCGFGPIAAIVYYFVEKRKLDSTVKHTTSVTAEVTQK